MKIVDYYNNKTYNFFDINSKHLIRWLKYVEDIKKSKRGTRRVWFTKKDAYCDVEDQNKLGLQKSIAFADPPTLASILLPTRKEIRFHLSIRTEAWRLLRAQML